MTEISNVSSLSRQVIAEVERAVVGKRDLLEMMMSSVLAGGHILLEDFPGLGKTLVARSFAKVLGLEFKRIQFTPDLLPGDITGGYIFNRTQNTFELRKGPVFANIILADEINRASPKTQSALLEAMQEGQVTIEGETLPLPNPFLVLATQNPIEYEGTFPLPEAQLDRFMLKLTVGYPSIEEEKLILKRRRERRQDEVVLREIGTAEQVLEMPRALLRLCMSMPTWKTILPPSCMPRALTAAWQSGQARVGRWRSSKLHAPMLRSTTATSSRLTISSAMRSRYWATA